MHESQVYCCYCSENLVDKCDYCKARIEIRELLNFPPPDLSEDENLFDKIFDKYNIAGKARLEILLETECHGDDWFV